MSSLSSRCYEPKCGLQVNSGISQDRTLLFDLAWPVTFTCPCCRDPTYGLEDISSRPLATSFSCWRGQMCGLRVEPHIPGNRLRSFDLVLPSPPESGKSPPSRFLQLPAEIRVLVYESLFHSYEDKPLICRLPSISRHCYTANLVGCRRNIRVSAKKPPRRFHAWSGSILETSKLLRNEATPVFNAIRVFRFNLEQILSLRPLRTSILRYLTHIEIDEPFVHTRMKKLPFIGTMPVMQIVVELSSLREMRTIKVGEDCIPELSFFLAVKDRLERIRNGDEVSYGSALIYPGLRTRHDFRKFYWQVVKIRKLQKVDIRFGEEFVKKTRKCCSRWERELGYKTQ